MTAVGTVRIWHGDGGWGVIDSDETPGGCWTHFSHVFTRGYRSLRPGQQVDLEWASPGQDGYDFMATKARPIGQPPSDDPPPSDSTPSQAYRSQLTITWDQP